MAHAQSRGHIFQIKWSYIFHPLWTFTQDTITFPWTGHLYPRQHFNSPFGKYEYVKVPFRLAQVPAYFQELMTGILKDFPFAIAYLDDIVIFSKTLQEHLSHTCKVFEKLKTANLSMKKSKCNFFSKEIQYLDHILSHYWNMTTTL